MAVISYNIFDGVCKSDFGGKVIEHMGITTFVLVNFLFGFLNAPIVIPILIKTYFLNRSIKRLRRENEEMEAALNAIKEMTNKKIQDLNKKYEI